jgi:hypothetical protein
VIGQQSKIGYDGLMTEIELRKKHAVAVAWSNTGGTLMQLLYGAFLNLPTFEVLSDFVEVMGLETVEREWTEMKSATTHNKDILRAKPYVERNLSKIRHEFGRTQIAA